MAAQAQCALAWAGLALAAGAWGGGRGTLSLDGEWQIEDSVAPDAMPREWHHRVPVPGLAHLAQPGFPDVDQFDSKEVIVNRVGKGVLPESALVEGAGIPHQNRAKVKLDDDLVLGSQAIASLDDLREYATGLICLTGGDEGPLAHALATGGIGRENAE